MIKKYHKFILETVGARNRHKMMVNNYIFSINQTSNNYNDEWVDKLLNLFADGIKTLDKIYSEWYGEMSKSDSDPDEDYQKMQNMMDQMGFPLSHIKTLFSKDICQKRFKTTDNGRMFLNFIKDNKLDKINGYIDFYLFKINEFLELNQTISLGGEDYNSDLQTDLNEIIIKYSYGYHKTKYGQLFLSQRGLSVEKFEGIIQDIVKKSVSNTNEFEKSFRDFLTRIIKNTKSGSSQSTKDIEKYYYLDENRLIIEYEILSIDLNVDIERIKSLILTTSFDVKIDPSFRLEVYNITVPFINISILKYIDNGKELIINLE